MNACTDAQRRHLRQQLTMRRRQLPPAQRMHAALSVRRSLEQLAAFHTSTRVAGYWAVNGELPLNIAMSSLTRHRQLFFLPQVGADQSLRFVPWHSGEPVKPNRYGIPEPLAAQTWLAPFQLDLVLIPLLAFDRHGQRLGHGNGYYDRNFAFLGGQVRPGVPLLVGIAYAFQEVNRIKARSWDIALDYVATEYELISCHFA